MERQMIRSSPRLEDIPELIHHIQLRLPVKEAARTSVLSKSWLHAWSTIPTLRFGDTVMNVSKEKKREHLEVVDRTLMRYLRDNIPIESIDLKIDIENQESASLAEKWIRPVTTKSCLNELSLSIVLSSASFILPDEILSGKSLTKIRVSGSPSKIHFLLMCSHSVINCVSLRKLYLEHVHLNEELLHNILSTCSLLVDLELLYCKGFDTIKVKNHHCLNKIRILSLERNRILEISDVPNLKVIRCQGNLLSFNSTYSFGRVTHLRLGDVIMDGTYLEMIESKFPMLESLTLNLRLWKLQSFHFTCAASVKRLSLMSCLPRLIDINVKAPNLTSFGFDGKTMPSLVFPATTNISLLEHILVVLSLSNPVGAPFFLRMSQALTLSIKCDIEITAMNDTVILPPFVIDIPNLRNRVPFPAMNVQRLSFRTNGDECQWERSPFFDALFSICHPKYVEAKPDKTFVHNNHFYKLMMMMTRDRKEINTGTSGECLNWPYYLKDSKIISEEEEDSLRSSADGSGRVIEFKLKWLQH